MTQWIVPKSQAHIQNLGYGDWLDESDRIIEQACEQWQLQPQSILPGGMLGAVIKVDFAGHPAVLKVMPPDLAAGQIQALQALDGTSAPRLQAADKEQGVLLLQYVQGRTMTRQDTVDLAQIAAVFSLFHNHPLATYSGTHISQVRQWMQAIRNNASATPVTLQWLQRAEQLLRSAPDMPLQHIHGDVGAHNFLVNDIGQLWTLDPAGISGPLAYDVGCLAFGVGDMYASPANVVAFAQQWQLPVREVARWALVRGAMVAGFTDIGAWDGYHRECVTVLPALWEQYHQW